MANEARDAALGAFIPNDPPNHNERLYWDAGWDAGWDAAIDEFVRRVYEKVSHITKPADLTILDALDAVAKELKNGE